MGQHCCFLRLSGCNLSCVWCDTSYTWNLSRTGGPNAGVRPDVQSYDPALEVHKMSAIDVLTKLYDLNTRMVIISGGEPMLQQAGLIPVVTALAANHKNVQFETNGTVLPSRDLIEVFQTFPYSLFFTVSPKLAHAKTKQIPVDIKAWMEYNAAFKFVCQRVEDLDEVEQLLGPNHDPSDVFIMAEGRTVDQLLTTQRVLIEGVLARGWNLSTRLHDLIWTDARAR